MERLGQSRRREDVTLRQDARNVPTEVMTHRTQGTQKIRHLRQKATPTDQTQDPLLLMKARTLNPTNIKGNTSVTIVPVPVTDHVESYSSNSENQYFPTDDNSLLWYTNLTTENSKDFRMIVEFFQIRESNMGRYSGICTPELAVQNLLWLVSFIFCLFYFISASALSLQQTGYAIVLLCLFCFAAGLFFGYWI